MSNFWQQKVARESAEAEQADMMTTFSIFGDLDSDAFTPPDGSETVSLEKDGETLASDMADSVELEDKIAEKDGEDMSEEAAEAVELAQESIRRRWGIQRSCLAQESSRVDGRERRVLARESISDTIKGLWERFIEWLKQIRDTLKDYWISFTNKGKTLNKKGKQFLDACSKLGEKTDDTISGDFIVKLSVNNKFIGNDATEINNAITTASTCATNQKDVFEAAAGIATSLTKKTLYSQADLGRNKEEIDRLVDNTFLSGKKELHFVGNKVLLVEEDSFVLTDLSNSAPASSINTPSTDGVKAACKNMMLIGQKLEKHLKDFRAANAARDKLIKHADEMSKHFKAFENGRTENIGASDEEFTEIEKSLSGVKDAAKRLTSRVTSLGNVLSKAEKHTWSELASGISGYVKACFSAYKKKKKD